MRIQLINTIEEWEKISKEWNQLLVGSIQNVPFLTFEFQRSWWEYRGGGEWPNAELNILVLRNDEDHIVGIAPLMKNTVDDGKKSLMFIGSVEIADYLDFIVSSINYQVFLTEILNYLSTDSGWDICELNNVLEGSPTLVETEIIANQFNLSYASKILQPSPRIKLPNDFDEYLNGLDKKYRHEMKRKIRNATSYFIPIKHYSIEDETVLSQEMDEFEKLMRNEDRKVDFLSGDMPQQMKSIAHAALKGGWLKLMFLDVGKEKAGGFFCFKYNKQLWLYNSGMSNKYGKISPGHVLMGLLIKESIETNLEYFDFMRGDEEYKTHLGGVNRYVYQVILSR